MGKQNQRIPENLALTIISARDNVPFGKARLSAALYHRKKLVATGCNSSKSSPFQARYSRNEQSIYFHAETACIRKASSFLSDLKMSKSILYVGRVYANGSAALARPCFGCMSCIEAFGISKVVYSISNQEYGIIRL